MILRPATLDDVRALAELGRSSFCATFEHLYKPEDLAATIYHALGINPELRLPDSQGRPVGLIDDGQAIAELFG